MISILLPSRDRPDQLARFIHSIHQTVDNPVEIIVRVDEDEPRMQGYKSLEEYITLLVGPRDVLSKYWNECYAAAHGDILMHAGDDLIFRTPHWDTVVQAAFAEYPDNIVFVHGDDGYWGHNFGTHGFIHRKWAETVGYFVPPYFSSDYNDTWLNEVANMIARRKFVEILTEHMHPAFGKAEWDLTHRERLERHRDDGVDALYLAKLPERVADADKLKEVML